MSLIVTQDGKPLPDQRLGVRLFKDACHGDRYRIVRKGFGWIIYYRGNRILDTREMQQGADNPGILIDQVRETRTRFAHLFRRVERK